MTPLRMLVTLLVLMGTLVGPAVAQDATPTTTAPPTVTHTPPAATTLETIDGAFGWTVEVMQSVLFYRLFTSERQYIVAERAEQYARDKATSSAESPFVRYDPNGTYSAEELTVADVSLLAAKDLLLSGDMVDGEQRRYRLGEADRYKSMYVEYVTVKMPHEDPDIPFGAKYVLDPTSGDWRQITSMRGLLSETEVLSLAEVASLAESGWLKTSGTPADPSKPYVLTEEVGGIPVVVAWLACGAVFFTLYMGFFNIRGFRHAIDIVRGKYDDPDDTGEVTHFQALASALSATVGLGNIAGVTIAMTVGGPGAFFWMLLCGLFGMTSKFVECTLGQKYRYVKPDGTVLGGPMRYLHFGLKEMNLGLFGAFLSIVFAVMCILASFGGGNMFQANQSGSAVLQIVQQDDLDELSQINTQIAVAAKADDVTQMQTLQQQRTDVQTRLAGTARIVKPVFGLILAALVAVVIIGGIKRIGAAAGKLVPTMCIMYVGACLFIILTHLGELPPLIASVFSEAFNATAMGGGLLGVLVVGVQRAAFSNEAGVGSAAIAHSAAKTEEPVREGCVALLGPFIDTIVVCSMTALVILITGAWDNSEWVVDQGLAGAALTSKAFESEISWFPYVLSVAVVLFAYSTIISWSYYGERAWETLFGARSTPIYKVLTVIAVFVGTIVNLGSVLDFSDMMILGMAFPNIAGVVLLAPRVKRDLAEYWGRYKADEFKEFK